MQRKINVAMSNEVVSGLFPFSLLFLFIWAHKGLRNNAG